jgi:teichuronic acid biosynthesis glycosyltransferase TuaG
LISEIKDNYSSEELVSIIMPAYNCANYIGTTIESVQNQTYNNWEIILVDDCSTDDTEQKVKLYMEKDKRITYYKLEVNSGAAIARNKAIDLAKGKYMAFLDSDDVWFPDKLTKQIKFMRKNKANFTCTSYTKIDDQGTDLNRTIIAKGRLDYDGVLKTCPGNSTVIYNSEQLGKFMIPDIKKRNDYVMWLQVMKKEKYLYGIEEPLSSHRIRNNAISSNKLSLVSYHWEVYRNFENLSFIKSIYLILYWVIVTVLKLR